MEERIKGGREMEKNDVGQEEEEWRENGEEMLTR